MDTNKMRDISREQFEARYPVPEGACWNAEQGRYVLFHLKLCTVAKYERFVESWVCWQASRDAVVIVLPEPQQKPDLGVGEYRQGKSDGVESGIIQCIKAIERQGYKVDA